MKSFFSYYYYYCMYFYFILLIYFPCIVKSYSKFNFILYVFMCIDCVSTHSL